MKRVSSKTIAYALLLMGALAYLSVTVTRTRPHGRTGETAKPPADTTAAASSETAQKPLAQAAPSDADFGRYQVIVTRNIFSPPAPPRPPAPKLTVPPPLVISPAEGRPQPPVALPPPSLTNWSYVGYVTIDRTTTGIIQNDETDSIQELKLGDQFQGYRVDAISREEMALSHGVTKVALKKPLDFPIVPLEGTAGSAPPGQAGGPGQRRGGGGGPPGR